MSVFCECFIWFFLPSISALAPQILQTRTLLVEGMFNKEPHSWQNWTFLASVTKTSDHSGFILFLYDYVSQWIVLVKIKGLLKKNKLFQVGVDGGNIYIKWRGGVVINFSLFLSIITYKICCCCLWLFFSFLFMEIFISVR